MTETSHQRMVTAVQEFNTARLHASLEQIRAALTGKSADLLSYEDVRRQVRARETAQRELTEIPLNAIVGSVGRYSDFTRSFLPRTESDKQRWTRVWHQAESLQGVPPIDVYQIGEVYFVRDGNHRVSVARMQSATHIEAYVTRVETSVPLTPDVDAQSLIRKARYAQFLEQAQLDDTVPDIDLSMSEAGNYRVLETQIRLHQHWIAQKSGDEPAYPAAAERWYWEVYWPVIVFMRQRGLLRDFPGRTETDLYVWIDQHRQALAEHLGWPVDAKAAVLDLADSRGAARGFGRKLRSAVTPNALEAGPTVGAWRKSWQSTYRDDRLFNHILVAINGQEAGWHALEQAIDVARREDGALFGVHVVSSREARTSAAALAVRDAFEERCAAAGIAGDLTITTGPTTGTICYRARWADLVVVSLSHPPGPQPTDRLSSRFSRLLRRCSRPVLAVPRTPAALDSLLLAYDGSPKANEALFVAAYLAAQWQKPLTAVTALGEHVRQRDADRARALLGERGINATYIVERAPAARLILDTATDQGSDLILMGGYGRKPVVEIVVGSAVDEVLRTRNRPILVCR